MKTDWTYEIHDAVVYNDLIGRIEDRAIDVNKQEVYLVQFTNHLFRWLPVEDLEEYIG